MSETHPSVALALSQVCRAAAEGETRRAFTVARTEAVLRMREVPRPGPWHWTLGLLRAANAVAADARASVQERDEGDQRVVTLTLTTPGFDGAAIELRGLVLAAAEGDPALSPGTDADHVRVARWRHLVGAALNAALAGGPASLELRTAAAAILYVRRDSPAAGQDPYGEQRGAGRCAPESFEVELRAPRPGFGRRLATWLSRQAAAEAALSDLWRASLPAADPGERAGTGVALGRPLPGTPVQLGSHARWGAAPALGGPWLVRDGVVLTSLATALARASVPAEEFAGWIDCPTLRLTADEATVAHDAALELLVAWLLDARAHTGEGGAVVWPTEVRHLASVGGRTAPIEVIAQRSAQGRDLLYAWRHQVDQVPAAISARVYALWPSELAVVLAQIPDVRAVPARALGISPQFDRVDLSSLAKGSLPPEQLERGAVRTAAGAQVELEVAAYVHRYPSSEPGAIALLAHGRRVAQVWEPTRVLAGVTLVATLTGEALAGLTIDALREDRALLHSAAERCRELGERAMGRLLAAALRQPSPWELPLVRVQATALSGAALGLRYRPRREDGALELAWEETPLLSLPVGRDMAGQAVTLQQALVRCRDAGGIVVEDPKQRWVDAGSEGPLHEPWSLTPPGRELISRVVGQDVLWDMPAIPAAQLQPRPASEQRRLLLSAPELERLLGRGTPASRAALRAHLLVAAATGPAPAELIDAPLLVRFDPRALQPVRLVPLSDARTEGLGLLPPGASSRALPGPALLVTPGEAVLLQALGLQAAAPSQSAAPVRGARPPIRRAGGREAPLSVLPVADALALGALRIDGVDPAKIAVWGGGLHIADLALPAPFDCVGGRLSLTRQGVRAGTDRLAEQMRALGRAIAARALHERLLHPPGTPQRAGLDAFRERCAAAEDPGDMRDRAGPEDQEIPALCAASLAKHPLRRIASGPKQLESLLRQALARPITVDTAMLSWKEGRISAAEGRGWSIELGRRSAWVQRALADDAPLGELFASAALVLASLFADARAQGLAGATLAEELVADYRLLALLYAHVP